MEAHGPYKINSFLKEAHSESPIINYKREHDISIDMTCGRNKKELTIALEYGAQYLALKEKDFMRRELAEQLQTGNVAIFTWGEAQNIKGL